MKHYKHVSRHLNLTNICYVLLLLKTPVMVIDLFREGSFGKVFHAYCVTVVLLIRRKRQIYPFLR